MNSQRFFEIQGWMTNFLSGRLSEANLLDMLEQLYVLVEDEILSLEDRLTNLATPEPFIVFVEKYEDHVSDFFETLDADEPWTKELLDEALHSFQSADQELDKLEQLLDRRNEGGFALSV